MESDMENKRILYTMSEQETELMELYQMYYKYLIKYEGNGDITWASLPIWNFQDFEQMIREEAIIKRGI